MQSEERLLTDKRSSKTTAHSSRGHMTPPEQEYGANSREPKLFHLRPAHHRAPDPARVGESDKHDRVEKKWVVFDGKVHDQP